jgi:hypothetical protein
MPFTDAVRHEIYERSHGRCECSRQHDGIDAPHHGERCANTFTFASGSGLTQWWEANHIQTEALGGQPTLENGEALCGACYQLVRAQGT